MKIQIYIVLRRMIYSLLAGIDTLFMSKTNAFALCYHGVDDSSWKFSVSLNTLRKQLISIQNEGYKFIPLEEFTKKSIYKDKVVTLTFDDGYRSLLKIAPILRELDIPASLFPISNTQNPNWSEIGKKDIFLSPTDIKELIKLGWSIGSHGATHSDLTALSDKELVSELEISKKYLEAIAGSTITHFAYPRGKYNQTVINKLISAGYKYGWTMDDGFYTGKMKPFQLPRIGVDATHSLSEFNILYSPSVIRFRQLIKHTPIRRFL